MQFIGFMILAAISIMIVLSSGVAATITTLQAYAQPTSDRRAVSQMIPVLDYIDTSFCDPNGEVIEISGYAHLVDRFVLDETSQHIVQHVNFQNVKGFGLTTGNNYIITNAYNNPSNTFLHPGFISGSGTQSNQVNIISQGSSPLAPNLTVHAVLHVTANANGQITADFENFNAECR